MLLPPFFIYVRIKEPGHNGYWIPVPFFLLWPLLLIVVGLAFVVAVVADAALAASGARYHRYTAVVTAFWELLAELRGMHVHIDDDATLVDVDIY